MTLSGFTHGFPSDVDVLLVGPTGVNVLLMSDTGDGIPVAGVTLTFDDATTSDLPETGQIVSGTYRPTNFDDLDAFFDPAPPVGPYGTALSDFNGTNPNGDWQLFVIDARRLPKRDRQRIVYAAARWRSSSRARMVTRRV